MTSAQGLVIKNPFRTQQLSWQEITLVLPGGNGLIVAGREHRAEAWCVQKTERNIRAERPGRADRVGNEIWSYWERHHPPVEIRGDYLLIRARPGVEVKLAELERRASIKALGFIFPGQRFPFPIDSVTERWREDLRDPTKQTFLAVPADRPAGNGETGTIHPSLSPERNPIGYLAHSSNAVLHFGVEPDFEGHECRTSLLSCAEAEIFSDALVTEASLWVLLDDQPALDFYHDHGWSETDNSRRSPYPPKPQELRMIKADPQATRRAGRAGD